MALARFEVKTGERGKGKPHFDYICRLGKYRKPDSDKEVEFTGHGNLPNWCANNPELFWQSVDEFERKNGTAYREHIITLPRELDKIQRHKLINDWIKSELKTDFPFQYAIHNPLASDGEEQPHCHLMFCERKLDGIERTADTFFKRYNAKNPERGGAKKMNTGLSQSVRKNRLIEQVERWEKLCNRYLKNAQIDTKVSLLREDTRKIKQAKSNLKKITEEQDKIVLDFDVDFMLDKVRKDNEQRRDIKRRSADNRLIESERIIEFSQSAINQSQQAIGRFGHLTKSTTNHQQLADSATEISHLWANQVEQRTRQNEQAIIFSNELVKASQQRVASSERRLDERDRLTAVVEGVNTDKIQPQSRAESTSDVPEFNRLKSKSKGLPRPRF